MSWRTKRQPEQGEDKPSPLLWTTWRPARSRVGAMACPRPGALQKSYAHPIVSDKELYMADTSSTRRSPIEAWSKLIESTMQEHPASQVETAYRQLEEETKGDPWLT